MIIAFKRVEVQHQVFKRRLKILCIDIDFEGGREGAHWFWEEGPSKGERGGPKWERTACIEPRAGSVSTPMAQAQ